MKTKKYVTLILIISLIANTAIFNIKDYGAESKKGLSVKLNKTVFTYTSKQIKPKLKIKYKGKTVSKENRGVLYYYNNKKIKFTQVKNIGKYKVKVTLKKPKITVVCNFKIIPKNINFTSYNNTDNSVKLKWKKDNSVTGYVIEYSTNSKFNNKKAVNIKNKNTTSKEIKLTAGYTYYFRIKSYKKVGSKNIYSNLSKVVSVKIASKNNTTQSKPTEKPTTKPTEQSTTTPTPSPTPTPEKRSIPKKWEDSATYTIHFPSFTSGNRFKAVQPGDINSTYIETTNYVTCMFCGTEYADPDEYFANDTCAKWTYSGSELNSIVKDSNGKDCLYSDYLTSSGQPYSIYTAEWSADGHYFTTWGELRQAGYINYSIQVNPAKTITTEVYPIGPTLVED